MSGWFASSVTPLGQTLRKNTEAYVARRKKLVHKLANHAHSTFVEKATTFSNDSSVEMFNITLGALLAETVKTLATQGTTIPDNLTADEKVEIVVHISDRLKEEQLIFSVCDYGAPGCESTDLAVCWTKIEVLEPAVAEPVAAIPEPAVAVEENAKLAE